MEMVGLFFITIDMFLARVIKSAVLLIHVHQSYMYMCFNATLSFV